MEDIKLHPCFKADVARKKTVLIFIRVVTALVLFSVLSKANVWLDATSNSLIAVGYRTLMFLAPLFLSLFGRKALTLSLVFVCAGTLMFFCTSTPSLMYTLAVLFAFGISVSGYLIKSEAAQTKDGAAFNKIAINIGSCLAGGLMVIPVLAVTSFAIIIAVLGIICVGLAGNVEAEEPIRKPAVIVSGGLVMIVTWAFAGFAIGLKLFAIFTILPQSITAHSGSLPAWFGWMLIWNSLIVVFLQIPVMRLINRARTHRMRVLMALVLLGFVVLVFTDEFKVYTFFGALVWMFIMSVVECSLTQIDYYSARLGTLFYKELAVGFGAGAAVLIMRVVPPHANTELIGMLGIILLSIWYLANRKLLNAQVAY